MLGRVLSNNSTLLYKTKHDFKIKRENEKDLFCSRGGGC